MDNASSALVNEASNHWHDLALLGVVVAIAIYYLYRKLWKKKGECGSCASCASGCASKGKKENPRQS
ncbi:FeoB-associated Cys-rich membrane protein [Photobacterium swingsii]|uniref:FeoB-associated Cys-rich membrane protein n=1 Tax=Photobacterium swingsii TaxID=680026 RepID=UPI0040676521